MGSKLCCSDIREQITQKENHPKRETIQEEIDDNSHNMQVFSQFILFYCVFIIDLIKILKEEDFFMFVLLKESMQL